MTDFQKMSHFDFGSFGVHYNYYIFIDFRIQPHKLLHSIT